MQSVTVEPYLSDAFLDRVRAVYRRAIAATKPMRGLWAFHDQRRIDVHAALLASGNDALRAVFSDPTATDLYYGVDDLCRSVIKLNNPSEFIPRALHHDRARIAAYQIERMRELMPSARTAVEIGPGMGRAAYYGHLAGISYTTIDLPLGIVAQACFLARALSPDSLWFAGEEPFLSSGKIKLHYHAPDFRFDVALNVDSITEMPASVAFDYIRWTAAHARLLLSINHDNNRFTVSQLATFSVPAQTIAKRPCPAWQGYMEEAFLLNQKDILPGRLRFAAFQTFILFHRIRRRLGRAFSF